MYVGVGVPLSLESLKSWVRMEAYLEPSNVKFVQFMQFMHLCRDQAGV